MTAVSSFLHKNNIRNHPNQGITVCPVNDAASGIELSYALLEALSDKKTAWYLSGGSTPKGLYAKVAKEEQLEPGAVGMVDERFGQKWHPKSNELMMKDTGLLRYLQMRGVPFYPILENESREKTADDYDAKVREMTATYPLSIGILGIGTDGHTSSLAPNRKDFKNPMFDPSQKHLMVSHFDDPKSMYGERVGMTFLGLTMLDVLVLLVFGADKTEAIEAMFDDGPEEEIPARFFKRPEIAEKTLFITDQNV